MLTPTKILPASGSRISNGETYGEDAASSRVSVASAPLPPSGVGRLSSLATPRRASAMANPFLVRGLQLPQNGMVSLTDTAAHMNNPVMLPPVILPLDGVIAADSLGVAPAPLPPRQFSCQ